MAVVYKITNMANGKSYIGGTVHSLIMRWACHKTSAKAKKRTALHVDMAIFGHENFSVQALVFCSDKRELAEQEDLFIRKYDTLIPNGYNSYLRTPRYFGSTPKVIEQILSNLKQTGRTMRFLTRRTGISYSSIYSTLKFRTISLSRERLNKINTALGTDFTLE